MNMVVQIVANTPPWVWVLLAFLLFLGIRALRPGTAPLWRIAILPAIFCVWGVSGLFSLHTPTLGRILPWLAAIAVGVGIGMAISRLQPIRADKTHGLVRVPGGPLTLVLILGIFATKYVFGVLHGMSPALFAEPRYWLTEIVLSGTLTGMFVGRFIGLWRQYQAAPSEDLSATA
jgi:hypothetical protein